MIQTKLVDVCEFQGGSQPPKHEWSEFNKAGFVRMLQIRDFTQNKKKHIEFVKDEYKLKKCKKEDILIGRYGASVGKILTGLEGAYNVALIKATPREGVLEKKFLYYLLTGVSFQNYLKGIGKRAAQAGFNKNDLKEFIFLLPDLPTQNKIVALLDKASALVQKRGKSIAQLDELLRAQFLEMFGDPILNPKGWEINKLNKICNLERGRFSPRPRNDPSYFNGDYPFIQTGDISNSNFRLTEYTQTLNSKGIKVSKEFKIGTIVIAIVGATIGKTAILEIDTYATDSIIGITPKINLCNNYFIEMILRFYKESLIDKAPSAARANINLKILNKLDIISPSLELQNKYETFNHRIESQKETLTQSKTELENLYNSLLQRAFSGQLNFNVDAELDALLAAIDLEQDTDKEKHDIKEIATVYAGRLLERIEEQNFENQTQYQQAKQVVFQMLEEGIVVQVYDAKTEAVKMKLV